MATTTISGESLPRLGGVGAALEATVLGVGIVGLIVASSVLRPWLAVLFGINAAMGGLSLDALSDTNAIDIVVLALSAIAFAGFWPGPGKPHRVWMGLAILLPLAGIAVLLATGLQGRSGLMGGGLVLSVLLIGNRTFRPLGYLAGVANLLLFVGDFATSGARSALVASLVAFGYILLIVWFVWIAWFLMSRTSTGPVPRSG
ncbi:MAG TPA: hypothetical protein VGC03_13360 [Acidimicrobiia bacterium]|jgi:hypothetical protein